MFSRAAFSRVPFSCIPNIAAASAPVVTVVGGIPRKHRGRYEITIDGQRFIARTVEALEVMVAGWRKAHPTRPAAKEITIPELPPLAQPFEAPDIAVPQGAPIVAPTLAAMPKFSAGDLAAVAQGVAREHAAAAAARAEAEARHREIVAQIAQAEAEHAARQEAERRALAAHWAPFVAAEEPDLEDMLSILLEVA